MHSKGVFRLFALDGIGGGNMFHYRCLPSQETSGLEWIESVARSMQYHTVLYIGRHAIVLGTIHSEERIVRYQESIWFMQYQVLGWAYTILPVCNTIQQNFSEILYTIDFTNKYSHIACWFGRFHCIPMTGLAACLVNVYNNSSWEWWYDIYQRVPRSIAFILRIHTTTSFNSPIATDIPCRLECDTNSPWMNAFTGRERESIEWNRIILVVFCTTR